MSCTVVIGSQWGDEGKAKMIDYFAKDADVVVRYQGGANAGHTVIVNGRKFVFHLVPSGILHKEKMCVIGNGLVLDPLQIIDELEQLEKDDPTVSSRLLISDAVQLILPYHKAMDAAMENMRGSNKIGTTNRGIGPCYADKCLRIGIRAGDIFNEKVLRDRLDFALKLKNLQLEKVYGREPVSMDEIMDILNAFKKKAGSMITGTQDYLHSAVRAGKKILLEGAQAYGLDIDHGTYPFVTSSNPTIGGALLGSGLNVFDVDRVVGIVKAYTTRVGSGPFPTEDEGADGNFLRERGGEFGATTGRPRRCGWFDLEFLKKSVMINGYSELALTKLDVLTGLKKIKVAVGYEVNGRRAERISPAALENAVPVYEELDGWAEDMSGCTSFDQLPSAAKDYIRFIEKGAGVKISVISTGADRENTFTL